MAIADFVMVLMFEVVDEINENIDDVVAYQIQAYREGYMSLASPVHPESTWMIGSRFVHVIKRDILL